MQAKTTATPVSTPIIKPVVADKGGVMAVPYPIKPDCCATMAGDDYARPGVLGTATTVHAIGQSAASGAAGAASGTLATFVSALKTGLKANAIVAGALSVVTNGYDAIKGRESFKQFLGLTAADGIAYAAIGAGATAGAAVATPLIIGAVPALAVAAPVIGIGIAAAAGLAASLAYGKLGHENLKKLLK